MYFIKFEIYRNIWLHIIFFLKKIVGYECVNFQFSQNDGYAQRLCISISNLVTYKRNCKKKEKKNLES
jgi:hypothetical protein